MCRLGLLWISAPSGLARQRHALPSVGRDIMSLNLASSRSHSRARLRPCRWAQGPRSLRRPAPRRDRMATRNHAIGQLITRRDCGLVVDAQSEEMASTRLYALIHEGLDAHLRRHRSDAVLPALSAKDSIPYIVDRMAGFVDQLTGTASRSSFRSQSRSTALGAGALDWTV